MKTTILIDLDDTLLTNPMDLFISTYLKLLGSNIGSEDSTEHIASQVMASTELMMRNSSPTTTLKEVFYNSFIPNVKSKSTKMNQEIDLFYKNEYKKVKSVTSPVPAAQSYIEYLEDNQYSISIATNPIFPATAIRQRLEWANLDPKNHSFKHITSFENYHFSKPQPEYYTELMMQIGWPEGPILMVGNDLEMDILPAQSLGFATYWVTTNDSPPPYECSEFRGMGSLDGIIEWMEKVPFETYTPNYKRPKALISLLKGSLAALQTLNKLLPKTGLSLKENEGWTIGEVFLHFLDVDKQINIPRFEKIVKEKESFIEGKIPNSWISKERYQNEEINKIFESFSNQRLLLISFLESLSEDDWQSKCRHSIFGPSNLIELVDFAARHDRIHIRQLHKILKSNDISLG